MDPEPETDPPKEKGPLERARNFETTQPDLLKGLSTSSKSPSPAQYRASGKLVRKALGYGKLSFYEYRVADIVLQYSLEEGRLHALIPNRKFFTETTGIDKSDLDDALKTLSRYGILEIRESLYSILPTDGWTNEWRVKQTSKLRDIESWLKNPCTNQGQLFFEDETRNDRGFALARQENFAESTSVSAVGESPTTVGDSPPYAGKRPTLVGDSPTKPFKEDSKVQAYKLPRPTASYGSGAKLPEALEKLRCAIGDKEWENPNESGFPPEGAKWGDRFYKKDYEKVERVANALTEDIKNGKMGLRPKIRTPAGHAERTWQEFAPSDNARGWNQFNRR